MKTIQNEMKTSIIFQRKTKSMEFETSDNIITDVCCFLNKK